MTLDYLSRIRCASTPDEAVALGHEFLRALGGASFDDQTAKLEELLPVASGESADMLRQLVSLRMRRSTIESTKMAKLKEVIDQLPGKADSEIDSLFCDLYANLTPLVAEGNALQAEIQTLALSAQARMYETLQERDLDELHNAHEVERSKLTEFAADIAAKAAIKAAESISSSGSIVPQPRQSMEPLSAVIEAYCANQNAEGHWTPKTDAENRAILALWLRIVGDQAVSSYGYEQHRNYKATLLRLPANINKSPRYRDLDITAILALGDEPAALNTINKSLTRIAALFKWAVEYGYTSLNPATGMTIKNPKRSSEERQAFTHDDLRKLLHSPEYLEDTRRSSTRFFVRICMAGSLRNERPW